MTWYKWSTTAATNATADGTINWAEGMAPSAVNDSARGMMAAAAKSRKDLGGVITGGSSTAYTAATNQVFDSLANLSGNILTISPHTTSGASPTLNVDGLGAKAINISTGVAIPTGALIAATPYQVVYVNASTEFILVGGVGVLSTVSGSSVSGGMVATQAQMETATATDLIVSPGRVRFNPGVAKAWVDYAYPGGVPTVNGSASHNVASFTDNNTGDATINFTTAFSAANYTFHGMSMPDSTSVGLLVGPFTTAKATTSMRVVAVTNVFTPANNGFNHAVFFGDQ